MSGPVTARTTYEDYHQKVLDGVNRAKFKNLKNALFSIRKDVIGSMPFAKGPAGKGAPPHAHFGNLRRSIRVAAEENKDEGVVGPSADVVGIRGYVLEFAGTKIESAQRDQSGRFVKGKQKRAKAPSGAKWAHPFMQPALERAVVRMQDDWRAAIS